MVGRARALRTRRCTGVGPGISSRRSSSSWSSMTEKPRDDCGVGEPAVTKADPARRRPTGRVERVVPPTDDWSGRSRLIYAAVKLSVTVAVRARLVRLTSQGAEKLPEHGPAL